MNKNQAVELMGRVSAAYGRGFKVETTAEWIRQLGPVDAHKADLALDRIIQAGEPGPSIARIISETKPAMPVGPPPTMPVGRDPGCECRSPEPDHIYGLLCDMHRRTGIDAIAQIRAQRQARRPVPEGEPS